MTQTDSNQHKQRVSVWVKLFVLFHLTAITIWALPNPPPSILEGRASPSGTDWVPYVNSKYLKPFPVVQDYLTVSGFWQYWDMFSPDPAQTDSWGDAEVTFKDKTVKRYQYPRMYLLSIPLKYQKERFRKFFERAGSDDDAFLWPVFALRIAHLLDDPKNPPVGVKLYRHFRRVAPPDKPQDQDYTNFMYYDYVVDPKLLADERAEKP